MLCVECLHKDTCAILNLYKSELKNSAISRWLDNIDFDIFKCKYFVYDAVRDKINNDIIDTEMEVYALSEQEYSHSIDMLIKEVEEICSCRCGMRNFYKQTERYDWI